MRIYTLIQEYEGFNAQIWTWLRIDNFEVVLLFYIYIYITKTIYFWSSARWNGRPLQLVKTNGSCRFSGVHPWWTNNQPIQLV